MWGLRTLRHWAVLPLLRLVPHLDQVCIILCQLCNRQFFDACHCGMHRASCGMSWRRSANQRAGWLFSRCQGVFVSAAMVSFYEGYTAYCTARGR